MSYGYSRKVGFDVGTAIERVTAELGERGFGILTTIDVQATLKKKIDVDRSPYVILGACSPHFAHRALQMEVGLGLLLPCNVVVYEDDRGETVVAAVDALAMMSVAKNPDLEPVAVEVNGLLEAAIDAV